MLFIYMFFHVTDWKSSFLQCSDMKQQPPAVVTDGILLRNCSTIYAVLATISIGRVKL